MEQRGCAKIGGNLTFSLAWDHAQVKDWLESLLPQAIHGGVLPRCHQNSLITKGFTLVGTLEQGNADPLNCAHFASDRKGSYKGQEKSGVADSHIYIGPSFLRGLIHCSLNFYHSKTQFQLIYMTVGIQILPKTMGLKTKTKKVMRALKVMRAVHLLNQ